MEAVGVGDSRGNGIDRILTLMIFNHAIWSVMYNLPVR